MWNLGELQSGEAAAERAVGEPIPEDLKPMVRRMVTAIMTRTAELAATRGGTMSAVEVEACLRSLEETKRGMTADELRGHITAQGATVATLQAKVEKAEREAHGALNGLLVVTEVLTDDPKEPAINAARRVVAERDAARAEVERLKADAALVDKMRRADLAVTKEYAARWKVAESRLAAILKAATGIRAQRMGDGEIDAALYGDEFAPKTRLDRLIKLLLSMTALVLEGDAPQEAKCTCNMLQRDTQWHDSDCPRAPPECRASQPTRYPCSPTCTHDDAANPGHPERVKNMSARFRRAMGQDTGSVEADAEVARLKVQVAELEKDRDEWRSARQDFSIISTALATPGAPLPEGKTAGGVVISSTVRDLRIEIERLTAQVERLQIDISGHVGTIREQHDTFTALQEQVARLTAAGAVLSEHVDMTLDGDHRTFGDVDPPQDASGHLNCGPACPGYLNSGHTHPRD
jgi:hypothetical protein